MIPQTLFTQVSRVAPSDAPVLIFGEIGCAQNVIAKELHDKSKRHNRPFVSIHCGTLRDTLMESEIFGHEKGAFTGAYSRKVGLLEVASGGTIYLEAVDELSPGLQSKLHGFMRTKEFYRIGGKEPIQSNVRIISSSFKSLDATVMQGLFREDLYYQLNVISLHAPTLRKRKDDIPELLKIFLKDTKVSEEVVTLLTNYSWPGNLLEMEKVCKQLIIMKAGDRIEVTDLPPNLTEDQFESTTYQSGMTLHELEKRTIIKALEHFEGNKTKTSEALGITIKTLYNKLHEYGLFEEFTTNKPKGLRLIADK